MAGEDENVLEKDGGDGYTTTRMYLVPLNCTIKNGKMVKVMLRIFYNNNNKKKQDNGVRGPPAL